MEYELKALQISQKGPLKHLMEQILNISLTVFAEILIYVPVFMTHLKPLRTPSNCSALTGVTCSITYPLLCEWRGVGPCVTPIFPFDGLLEF